MTGELRFLLQHVHLVRITFCKLLFLKFPSLCFSSQPTGLPSFDCAGNVYTFINESFTFDRAVHMCKILGDGWTLAMPKSSAENECVYRAAGSPTRDDYSAIGMWLGITSANGRDYSRISDNARVNYTSWASGHPFRNGPRTCALMWFKAWQGNDRDNGSMWGDDDCEENGHTFLVTCQGTSEPSSSFPFVAFPVCSLPMSTSAYVYLNHGID